MQLRFDDQTRIASSRGGVEFEGGRERKMCKGTHPDGGGRESFIIEKGEDWWRAGSMNRDVFPIAPASSVERLDTSV